jgi:hypothetical protein
MLMDIKFILYVTIIDIINFFPIYFLIKESQEYKVIAYLYKDYTIFKLYDV